jgi:hypothetical protein
MVAGARIVNMMKQWYESISDGLVQWRDGRCHIVYYRLPNEKVVKVKVILNSKLLHILDILPFEKSLFVQTIGSTILVNGNWLPKQQLRHELVHVEQRWRKGLLSFQWHYFIDLIKNGYWKNKYEIEARKVAGEDLDKPTSIIPAPVQSKWYGK